MKKIIVIILAGISLTACSPQLSPFTNTLVRDFQFDQEALSKIQFYLSENIILRRELRQGESTIDRGKISIKDGRKIEEIVFKEGTPGVYVFSPGDQRIAIYFERNENNYLIFGPTKNPRGYRGPAGVYRLLAKEWENNYGIITYAGKEYSTPSSSAYATLLVDIDKRSRVNRRVKEVNGRTVR